MMTKGRSSRPLRRELNKRWPAGARAARKVRNRIVTALGGTPPAPKKAKKPVRKKVTAPAAPAAPMYPSARAQRPIGIAYDELSRGINPFSEIETHGVADVTDSPEHIADLFRQFGIVKLRRLYTPEKSRQLLETIIDFSGLEPLDYRAVFNKEKEWGTGGTPVLRDERFWPYVVEPRLAEAVKLIVGENSFEFGSAISAHYSARGLHRDYRDLVEEDTPYNVHHPEKYIVRVLHYSAMNGGALGFIPFSWDERKFAEQASRIGLTHDIDWFNRHRDVLRDARKRRDFVEADEIERHVCWAYADPGDVIISNSAMLHAGEYLTGPRYFFVSTYAESNQWTLPRTNGKARRARDYHEFLISHGFKGAADIISRDAAIDAGTLVVGAEAPEAAMGGSMG